MTSKVVQWLGGKIARENALAVEYSSEQLRLRIEAEEEAKHVGTSLRKDLMHYLLNGRDTKSGYQPNMAELKTDTFLMIGAGADTVATTISTALFYFLRYPSTLQKAVSEIRTTFSDVSEIRAGKKLDGCVYLQVCIDESLRASPSVPSVLPREVLPGGIEIDRHHIPAGVIVGVPAYVVHHDPEYFPEPWQFRPERWIEDVQTGVSRQSVERAKRAFCPFSLGSRGCIAKNLGNVEVKIALAYVLFQYDVREAPGARVGGGGPQMGEGRHRVDEYQLYDCFGSDRDGPMVQFKRA